jgi:aspartate racemase
MKTLGIVGGIGPESTVDYYRSLIQMWREQTKDGSAPAILMNSIDLKKMLDLIAAKALSEVTAYLSGEMQRLARAGADVGSFAANTPPHCFWRASAPIAHPLDQHCGGDA